MKNQAIFILLGFLMITGCGENHKKSTAQEDFDDSFFFEDFGAPAIATCKNDTDCGPNQLCMVGTCINKINKNEEPDIGADEPKTECTINYHCNGDEECVDRSCVAKAADDEEADKESDDDEDDDTNKDNLADCVDAVYLEANTSTFPYSDQGCTDWFQYYVEYYTSDPSEKSKYETKNVCKFKENYTNAELTCTEGSLLEEQDNCELELNACLASIPDSCATLLTLEKSDTACSALLAACPFYQDMNKSYPAILENECGKELNKLYLSAPDGYLIGIDAE